MERARQTSPVWPGHPIPPEESGVDIAARQREIRHGLHGIVKPSGAPGAHYCTHALRCQAKTRVATQSTGLLMEGVHTLIDYGQQSANPSVGDSSVALSVITGPPRSSPSVAFNKRLQARTARTFQRRVYDEVGRTIGTDAGSRSRVCLCAERDCSGTFSNHHYEWQSVAAGES